MLAHAAPRLTAPQGMSPLIRSRHLIAIIRNLFSSGAPLETVNLSLGELLQNLENHLLHSLGDDFYEESVFSNPWLTRASEALRQQQIEVETALEQLRRSSQQSDQSKVPPNEFQKDFEHCMGLFHDHEVAIQMFVQCGNNTF